MKPIDFATALGVAVAVIAITMALSFPMVAFYAYVIEPGQTEAFYTDAAQWIAPWSSHIFGPLLLFWLNFRLARRRPERNAMLFATATLVAYIVADLSLLTMMGLPIAPAVTVTFALSFAAKAAGAYFGAYRGGQSAAPPKPETAV